nr:MAG TPA: antitoxin [Caudoviricetes sp.]
MQGVIMANAKTEHSKKLRAKTATARNKQLIADGKLKQISLKLDADTAAEFDAILSEFGASRPQAIKALCEFYRTQQKSR